MTPFARFSKFRFFHLIWVDQFPFSSLDFLVPLPGLGKPPQAQEILPTLKPSKGKKRVLAAIGQTTHGLNLWIMACFQANHYGWPNMLQLALVSCWLQQAYADQSPFHPSKFRPDLMRSSWDILRWVAEAAVFPTTLPIFLPNFTNSFPSLFPQSSHFAQTFPAFFPYVPNWCQCFLNLATFFPVVSQFVPIFPHVLRIFPRPDAPGDLPRSGLRCGREVPALGPGGIYLGPERGLAKDINVIKCLIWYLYVCLKHVYLDYIYIYVCTSIQRE